MKIAITGSKVHRVWKCPPSAVLPQIDQGDRHAPARGKGKGVHSFLERVGAVGAAQALGESPLEIHPLLRAIDTDDVPVGLATEVAFAWNWRLGTARELGRNLDRAYHLAEPPLDPDSEIPCTLDLVGVQAIDQGYRGYVGDYKTGHTKYPAPDSFGQTLLGALCVRSVYGCDEVVVELIHIHDDGGNHKVRRTVDDWELDTFARELSDTMVAVSFWEAEYAAGRAVAAHEGVWCEYCDAYKNCPAKVALVRSIPAELMKLGVVANQETGTLELRPGALSVRNAADAWMVLEMIAEVVNRAKDEIIGIACMEEIPLPDGRVIGRLVTEKRAVNGQIGGEVLEARYGRAERDKRVTVKLTLSAIEQAVVANLKPGEKMQTRKSDGVLDRVLAEIDRKGGLAIESNDRVAPHVPKRKAT